MPSYDFFNFKFLPKYGYAVVQGVEYTLILSVISVLLAVLPALLLATMRLSKCKPVRWLSGAYIAVFRSTPMLVRLVILPQAVKNVLPALANEVITMVKESSICMMLGMGEIMFTAQTISGSSVENILRRKQGVGTNPFRQEYHTTEVYDS